MTLELLVVNLLHVCGPEILNLSKKTPVSGSLESVDFKDEALIYI